MLPEAGFSTPETIFLDRDGVINRKRPEGDYVKNWAEFEFLPGALEGMRLLARLPARILVVTNQRGIARGRMTEQDLADIHRRMLEAIADAGGRIDAIYHCAHEEGACECRKPRTGMFLAARHDFPEIDFARALVVGDSLSDLEAAARLGCPAVLVAAVPGREATLKKAQSKGLRAAGAVDSILRLGEWLAAGIGRGCG